LNGRSSLAHNDDEYIKDKMILMFGWNRNN